MSWVGLDIGGANLKAADGRGWACSVPFALWRNPDGLAEALADLIGRAPAVERLAVTMTGELCDCFHSKTDGVRHILAAVEQVASGREVQVYLVEGRFASLTEARELPHLAAASNWHALGRFACRLINSPAGLLIDIGSTTTDIIPLVGGEVVARGTNDTERLLSGELLYRGVGRTPVCAVVRTLPWRGNDCPVAAELFATTADAYVLLGELAEDPQADWTADGRPLTRECARQRLARQLCADAADISPEGFRRIAEAVQAAQIGELQACIEQVAQQMPLPPSACILSGSGEFLAQSAAKAALGDCQLLFLRTQIGDPASICGPTHAVAVLASEWQ
jgi:probable H4MPT-linked C1 transfer pathway protein